MYFEIGAPGLRGVDVALTFESEQNEIERRGGPPAADPVSSEAGFFVVERTV